MSRDSARRRLLADADGNISLARAIDQAQKQEQGEQNAKALKATEASLKKLSHAPHRDGLPKKPLQKTVLPMRTDES